MWGAVFGKFVFIPQPMTDIAGYCDIVFSFPPLVGDTVRELSYNKTLIRYWTQANTVRVGDFKINYA